MQKKLATFEVAYKNKRQIAEGTYEYTFEKPADIHFVAGQHIRMSLIDPPETDAEGDKRFFTMASTPQEPDLKFAWRVRDTAFKRVVDKLQPGDKVIVQKMLGEAPEGSFVLHQDASVPAVFICGGIGIVPAYAMVKDAIGRGLGHKMYLFYSNRRPEDAPYLNELQKIARQNQNFVLVATMTEPEKSAQAWQGEMGLIDRAMLEKYVNDLRVPIYYVSGLPEMVTALRDVLDKAGVAKGAIRAEEFTGFKMGEGMHGRPKKNYLLITLVVLAVILLGVIHVGGISHTDFTKLSLENPVSYLIIAGLLIVIGLKAVAMLKMGKTMHAKRGKMSAQDIVAAHKPGSKREEQ